MKETIFALRSDHIAEEILKNIKPFLNHSVLYHKLHWLRIVRLIEDKKTAPGGWIADTDSARGD